MDKKTEAKNEALPERQPIPVMDVRPPRPSETVVVAEPTSDTELRTPPAEDTDNPEQLTNEKPTALAPVQKPPKPPKQHSANFTSTVIMVLILVMALLSAGAIFAYSQSK